MVQNNARFFKHSRLSILILNLVSVFILITGTPAHATTIDRAKQLITAKDFSGAHTIYLSLAKKGDREAQYSLGVLYRNGHGINKDLKLAYKWFRASAKQNHEKSQYELGILYKSGLGTDKNLVKAQYR